MSSKRKLTFLDLEASFFLLFENQLKTRSSVARSSTPLFKPSARLHSEARRALSSFFGFVWLSNASCRTCRLAGPHLKRLRRTFGSTRVVKRSRIMIRIKFSNLLQINCKYSILQKLTSDQFFGNRQVFFDSLATI
jgi:hypothetical protein